MTTALTILRRVLIVLAFVAVLVRPGYGEREVQTEVADVEVMVVVDRTRSMAAVDFDGQRPRAAGVREDLHALVEALPGTRFSLVTWGTDARLELPFTTDTGAFLGAVDTMDLEDPYDGSGTRIDTPLQVTTEALAQAEEQYPDRQRMLVFLSDGENTAEGRPDSYAGLADYVDGGLVLGYGTKEGARMPLADDLSDAEGYVRTADGPAISRADPASLRRLADDTGTEFVRRSAPGGIGDLAAGFEGEYVTETTAATDLPAEHDLTWVAGLVLFALLLWELHADWRALWSSRATLGAGGHGRRTTEGVRR
jgi:Ca-activated chloride channel homolog